jgi:tRNA nucleotidyltransferase (CCA-adding enzyme)
MTMPLDAAVPPADAQRLRHVGCLARDLGLRAFLVGGSVRDQLMGRSHVDWDLVTEGPAADLARALAAEWNGRVVVHDRFLTANVVLPGGHCVDIATARSESYPRPGALPDVAAADIGQDLWRRDFAINAIAVALSPDRWAEVVDPAGGAADIGHGVVRALHPRSFWDDATRVIRAVGFEQRLGFRIEPGTEQLIRQATRGGALQTVSSERLGEAIMPLLAGTVGPAVLRRGSELGVARALGASTAFSRRSLRALAAVSEALADLGLADRPQSRALACLAALLLGRGIQPGSVAERLHLTRPLARELAAARRYLDAWPGGLHAPASDAAVLRLLRGAGEGPVLALWLASESQRARAALRDYWHALRHVRPDFPLAELQRLGHSAGPHYAAALAAAVDAKLERGADASEQLEAALAAMPGPSPGAP